MDSKAQYLTQKVTPTHRTIVKVKDVEVGGSSFIVMAGPCSVESKDQLLSIASFVKSNGAQILRGGTFKPRTSPYSFQGLGEEGLKIMYEVGNRIGIPTVTEVLSDSDVSLISDYVDMLQIGARNISNSALLKRVGKTNLPVLLKRGPMTTIAEFLLSAEYILYAGNPNVILCERGIRTFETKTRNTLDISAVPVLQHLTHLPVILDPSHAAGYWEYVSPLSKAALAVGASGILVEVHPNPSCALSDGEQSLKYNTFSTLMKELKILESAMQKLE